MVQLVEMKLRMFDVSGGGINMEAREKTSE